MAHVEPDNGGFAAPDMFEKELDEAELDSLFHDLAALVDVEQVRMKRPGHDECVTLAAARAAMKSTPTCTIQVRYRYEQDLWCDTLLRRDDGPVRIVRVRIPSS